MNRIDPSEAVRSSKILRLLETYFDIEEFRGYGGAVLHILLSDIAGNFMSVVGEKILEMCFKVEDVLMELGEVGNDFAVIACKPKA